MGQTCIIGAGAPLEKLGLPTMAYMKGLHPKGEPFSGFRYTEMVGISLVAVY